MVGDSSHVPDDLLLGMTRYSLYWRLGGPKDGPNGCWKSFPIGIRSPSRAARSKSLHRLRCRGHHLLNILSQCRTIPYDEVSTASTVSFYRNKSGSNDNITQGTTTTPLRSRRSGRKGSNRNSIYIWSNMYRSLNATVAQPKIAISS